MVLQMCVRTVGGFNTGLWRFTSTLSVLVLTAIILCVEIEKRVNASLAYRMQLPRFFPQHSEPVSFLPSLTCSKAPMRFLYTPPKALMSRQQGAFISRPVTCCWQSNPLTQPWSKLQKPLQLGFNLCFLRNIFSSQRDGQSCWILHLWETNYPLCHPQFCVAYDFTVKWYKGLIYSQRVFPMYRR
jgi:hypothetical protein